MTLNEQAKQVRNLTGKSGGGEPTPGNFAKLTLLKAWILPFKSCDSENYWR